MMKPELEIAILYERYCWIEISGVKEMHKEDKIIKAICNRCGRMLIGEANLIKEGACTVRIDWGYFSHKDGETHQFCLCEECYDEIVKTFQIPVDISERTELLS